MLREARNMVGFAIAAANGGIGYATDCYFDDAAWVIRYLIVETGFWLSNRILSREQVRILVAPAWITDVSWAPRRITVDLTRQGIQESPPYDAARLPDRPQETLIHEHYGRNGYWQSEIGSAAPARKGGSEARRQR